MLFAQKLLEDSPVSVPNSKISRKGCQMTSKNQFYLICLMQSSKGDKYPAKI